MFPNFSYIGYYFFDTPPDGALSVVVTYGFFLMLGVYLATVLFKIEMRRKEALGLLGMPPQNSSSEYGGIFTENFLNAHTLMAVIGGLLGAKMFSIMEVLPEFIASPRETFFNAGMTAYGGLIVGPLTSYLYFKRQNISFIHVLDAVSPALFLAYGSARIGCQLSGDGCWGVVAPTKPAWWFLPDWMWSFDFPHNIGRLGENIEGCSFRYHQVLDAPVFPTSFYEMVMAFVFFILLWNIQKKAVPTGLLFGTYLILNGFGRFFIEFIRVNKKYNLFGWDLSQAQIIALLLMLSGVILCVVVLRKKGQT